MKYQSKPDLERKRVFPTHNHVFHSNLNAITQMLINREGDLQTKKREDKRREAGEHTENVEWQTLSVA